MSASKDSLPELPEGIGKVRRWTSNSYSVDIYPQWIERAPDGEPLFNADMMRDIHAAGYRAGLERAAALADDIEAGDGSHDFNAGAVTATEMIAAAIRAEKQR